MTQPLTIYRHARTLPEARRYAAALRILGFEAVITATGLWQEGAHAPIPTSGVVVTGLRGGILHGRGMFRPELRYTMPADRLRAGKVLFLVTGKGPQTAPDLTPQEHGVAYER
jgi:hypothetical protein